MNEAKTHEAHAFQRGLSAISTGFAEYFGFRRPFNFRVALLFSANSILLVLLLLLALFLFLNGGLIFRSERFYFFTYMAALLLVGGAFSRISSISFVIMLWCAIELGLGLASGAIQRYTNSGAAGSLLPRNAIAEPDRRPTHMYHPLLHTVLRPSIEFESRPADRRRDEGQFRGWLINWATFNGLKVRIVHNSLGLRGAQPTDSDLSKKIIFVYGGSTTYDPMVTQGETWVERLSSELRGEYTLLNFGVSGHSSIGAKYIDAGAGNFSNDDFADWGHFVAAGAEKFATSIAGEVGGYCK